MTARGFQGGCYPFARYHHWRQATPAYSRVGGVWRLAGNGILAEVIAGRNDDPGLFRGRVSEFLFTLLLGKLSMIHGAAEAYFFSHLSGRLDCRYGSGKFRLRKISGINTLMATRPND